MITARISAWVVALAPLLAAPATAAPPAPANDGAAFEQLLKQLNAISAQITDKTTPEQSVALHLQQADVLLQLAALNPEDATQWLRSAVDCVYSAAVGSSTADRRAYDRLVGMPAEIRAIDRSSPVAAYAGLLEVRAAYERYIQKSPDQLESSREHLATRLLRFADAYPTSAEAPKAILEAAEICEKLGKTEKARAYYTQLAERYADKPVGRQARSAAWRVAGRGAPVELQLQALFPNGRSNNGAWTLASQRGKIVCLYFWTTANADNAVVAPAARDLTLLRQLADRYQSRNVEFVCVNLDDDASAARSFLSDRLPVGVQLHQKGGLDSRVANQLALAALPHLMLIDAEGKLIRHQIALNQLDAELDRLSKRD